MKIYRTERMVTEYEVNEEEFLTFLKVNNPDDEDIQNAQTFDDLLKGYSLDDFSDELSLFAGGGDVISYHNMFHDNYDEAYDDMEFGIH